MLPSSDVRSCSLRSIFPFQLLTSSRHKYLFLCLSLREGANAHEECFNSNLYGSNIGGKFSYPENSIRTKLQSSSATFDNYSVRFALQVDTLASLGLAHFKSGNSEKGVRWIAVPIFFCGIHISYLASTLRLRSYPDFRY